MTVIRITRLLLGIIDCAEYRENHRQCGNYAQEYPIKKANLFGSYANGNNTPDSDVDILVEFTTPRVSLLTLNSVKFRLEELLQASVDVVHGPLADGSMIEIDKSIQVYGA